ncbi:MAG: hypothetical protein PHP53_24040 [Prolixibacteraceae bacterium]|nr:hypothetical protein [Prolixibacteraceae bacterium]
MDIRSKIEVMEAFERGEEIECAAAGYDTNWHYVKTPSWDWRENDYRIKTRQKEGVVLETWLIGSHSLEMFTIEGTKTYCSNYTGKVKLLATREVEL